MEHIYPMLKKRSFPTLGIEEPRALPSALHLHLMLENQSFNIAYSNDSKNHNPNPRMSEQNPLQGSRTVITNNNLFFRQLPPVPPLPPRRLLPQTTTQYLNNTYQNNNAYGNILNCHINRLQPNYARFHHQVSDNQNNILWKQTKVSRQSNDPYP